MALTAVVVDVGCVVHKRHMMVNCTRQPMFFVVQNLVGEIRLRIKMA